MHRDSMGGPRATLGGVTIATGLSILSGVRTGFDSTCHRAALHAKKARHGGGLPARGLSRFALSRDRIERFWRFRQVCFVPILLKKSAASNHAKQSVAHRAP